MKEFTQHMALVNEISTLVVDFLGAFTLLIPNVQSGPASDLEHHEILFHLPQPTNKGEPKSKLLPEEKLRER